MPNVTNKLLDAAASNSARICIGALPYYIRYDTVSASIMILWYLIRYDMECPLQGMMSGVGGGVDTINDISHVQLAPSDWGRVQE